MNPFQIAMRAWTVLGAALLVALLSGLAVAAGARADWPFRKREAPLAERAAALLSQAIQIDTTVPPGGEAALAEAWREVLADADVEARVVPTPGAGRGALWARVPGSGTARPLILLSHLDVVPADPDEWRVDPFGGEIRDGHVWGRGALDAKGVGVVQLLTLIQLARRDTALPRDVILLATPDEETGGRNGAGWLVREHPELLRDAEFLLTEGGSVRPGEDHRPSVWGVTVTEKQPCWLALRARGTPGHSSAPTRDAAVPRLVAALDRVRRTETPIRVIPAVSRMFFQLAGLAAEEDRAGYRNLEVALSEDSPFRRRFLGSRGRNALVRDTVAITVLEGGPRTNVSPSVASAHLDVRLLPGGRCEDFVSELEEVVADPELSLEVLLSFAAGVSGTDTALYRAIQQTAAAREPGALVVPQVIAGFTDAHWFRDRGIAAYGFVPRWIAPADTRGVHGVDERVSIANLERGVETLLAILDQLAQLDHQATQP
ncbi:MAG: M20/M25/M40 family metallo-hydrolase [Proteobacteria bacterium]|nr:M20/M25/M40 family metallo-hydrolase [Pseudomonadota bacterium]